MSAQSPEWKEKAKADARAFVKTAIMNLELRARESIAKHAPLVEQSPEILAIFREAYLASAVQTMIVTAKDASLAHEERLKARIGEMFKQARGEIAKAQLMGQVTGMQT